MKGLAVLLVVLVAATLAAAVEPARACSCALPNPRAALTQADGAFVGKLLSRRDGDQRAVLTFSVERALKGAIGKTVEVVTASNSAACGIELRTGARTGLVLERRDGAWQGSLCWQFDPDELLAAASPLPAPDGQGPVVLVLGAELGDVRLIALDAQGRTLAYGRGGGRTLHVSFCPGRRRLVEIASTTSGTGTMLVVRETRTLRTLRRQELRLPTFRYAQRLRCQDRAGTSAILFARGGRDSATRSALYRIRENRLRTVWEGSAYDAALSPSVAYLSAGRRGRQLVALDLSTRRVRLVAELPAAASGLEVDDREAWLAAIGNQGPGRSDIVAVELDTGLVRARTISRRQVQGQLAWLPSGRLLFLPAWGAGLARVLDPTLRVRSQFAWNAASGAVAGPDVFGIDNTLSLSRAQLPSGPQRAVRRLPGRASLIVSAAG
jgi:hypothetical protein